MSSQKDVAEAADAMLAQLFSQARRQFGNAIKGYWFYDPDPCPGCGRAIDAVKLKGKDGLSLNAFIYRERGILIGYLLCSRCAKQIFQASKVNPNKQIPLHTTIETNLIKAYLRQLQ
ncbi:MAG: hypothetical protein U0350_27740 [Caldilineaceae bacterium]